MKTAARRHREAPLTPGHEVPPAGPNRRQPLLDYKVPNLFGVHTEQRRVRNHEGLSLPVRYRAQGALDVVGSAHLHRVQFHPSSWAVRSSALSHFWSLGKQPPA